MKSLICDKEKLLGTLTLVLGIMAWSLLFLGTFGMIIFILLGGYVFYLFAQSALIAYVKGNGVKVTSTQFPELYKQYVSCCETLEMTKHPEIYLLNGDGGMNAFATKFLGSHFVILLSDIVDAMDEHEDGVRFYIGHELGHIKLNHLTGTLFRWPALWLPLVGAAYGRAKERSCDNHGRACCSSNENAAKALAALSTGGEQWKKVNIEELSEQAQEGGSFWMSLHELFSGYPWLTKRIARIANPEKKLPEHHPLAIILAIGAPYGGKAGPITSMIIMFYVVGVLAAVAMPKFSDAITKARTTNATIETEMIRDSLGSVYERTGSVPTLEELNLPNETASGTKLSLSSTDMVLTAMASNTEVVFVPRLAEDGSVFWITQED